MVQMTIRRNTLWLTY